MTRVKLSVRLGVVGGIIWGLLFTAYYSMLPYMNIAQSTRYMFAVVSATLCFIVLVVLVFALPYIQNEWRKQDQVCDDDEDYEDEDE